MANIVTKHIPNTLTSCNLISGCIAIVFAVSANSVSYTHLTLPTILRV